MQRHRMCNLASEFDGCQLRKETCSFEEERLPYRARATRWHVGGMRNKVKTGIAFSHLHLPSLTFT